jgi:hypothetical protein
MNENGDVIRSQVLSVSFVTRYVLGYPKIVLAAEKQFEIEFVQGCHWG